MKNKILSITFFIVLSISVAGQSSLKKSIGVIRPHNDKNTETFFSNYAAVLNRQGYREAAKYVASLGGSSFGSCFVIQGNDGRFYAITNRHAVEFADSATIQFIEGRDTTTYNGLEIAKVSEELDLAAVMLPMGIDFTPLSIYDGSIEDGTEVFTAGFPGVTGKPSWQFGKGIVSNSQFYNDLLTNDSNRWVIQHTAQIDAGSSGGPLLIKDGSGYKVAGVNTWKVSNRDEMNLSINNKDLTQFIASLGNIYKESNDELNLLYSQLATDVQNGYRNILPHLSYTYMFFLTTTEIDNSFSNMPKVLREDIDNLMKIGHFTEALRLLSAFNAAKQIAENPFVFQSTVRKDNEVILVGENKMEVVFVWEKSAWRISKVGRNSSRKQAASNATDAYGVGITNRISGIMMQIRVLTPVTKPISQDYGIGIQLSAGNCKKFMSYEGLLEYLRCKESNCMDVHLRVGGQLPIQLSPHVLIMPVVKLGLGMNIAVSGADDIFSDINVSGIGGFDFLFRLGNLRKYMMIGVSYEHRLFIPLFRNDDFNNIGYVGSHIGFIF